MLQCSITATIGLDIAAVKRYFRSCATQHWKGSVKPSPVLIKKYGNRRLYDTAGSRYINLDDIARLIREGQEVKVLDAQSGKDLTRVTLTQIITEDAKEKPTGLPLELLRQLIVASDEVRQEFIMWYLKSAFDTYQKVQDAVQNRLGEVESAILSPVDMMKRFLGSAPAPPERDGSAEVEALRKRVAELEGRLRGARGKSRQERQGRRR
jgi:polyhydroxyalkanoate synthesis repressor PhaR